MPPRYSAADLPCGIWERIAFHAVASDDAFLGPPHAICAISLLSHNVYNQISSKSNTHLYARIFRFKFDAHALARRFSARWRTTRCLTVELIKRFRALKRIKITEVEVDDVWTAYLMFLENDGKNEAQLEHAGFKLYLKFLLMRREMSQELSWFKNPTLDSLIIWLLWETSDRGLIRLEGLGSAFRDVLIGLLHSLIITGYKFSSTYGPDIYFSLPLGRNVAKVDLEGYWKQPPKAEIIHYAHRLCLSAPVIAPAAILSLVVQADAFQDSTNIPVVVRHLPRDRAEAIARGRNGPTAADILDYHLHTRPPTVQRCNPLIDASYVESIEEDGSEATSLAYGSIDRDEDWYRLVACHDPWAGETPLRGAVYKPGALAGRWAGRLLIPDFELYTSLLHGRSNPSTVSIRHNPLYWELQEHHCLSPNNPLEPGQDDQWGDDILNAWLPRGLTFTHVEGALEIYDPNTGNTARYETVIPGKAVLYSSTERVSKVWISDEEIADDDHAAKSVPASGLGPDSITIDDDDEYCDTVSYLSSGISDILITGKTGNHYGQAWGHFTIYGRVRSWDGLVTLLRVPSEPSERDMGKWIFKGYLHGPNLVGRWRETSTPTSFIGYEGGFVVYKTDVAVNN